MEITNRYASRIYTQSAANGLGWNYLCDAVWIARRCLVLEFPRRQVLACDSHSVLLDFVDHRFCVCLNPSNGYVMII